MNLTDVADVIGIIRDVTLLLLLLVVLVVVVGVGVVVVVVVVGVAVVELEDEEELPPPPPLMPCTTQVLLAGVTVIVSVGCPPAKDKLRTEEEDPQVNMAILLLNE